LAVIDMEALEAELLTASEDEVYENLVGRCRELFAMTPQELVAAFDSGEGVDHPAAPRFEVLARALIELD
jgi:hypothetical protein